MAVFAAAPSRRKGSDNREKILVLPTIREESKIELMVDENLYGKANTNTDMAVIFARNTTIYSDGSIRSICKKMMRKCYQSCSMTTSRLTLLQSRKGELMAEKIGKYYYRRRERELADHERALAKQSELHDSYRF